MEGSSDMKDSSQCVRVAVNVRPLVTAELLVGCSDCVTLVSGEPQVQIGSHSFTFDYVYGSSGSPSSQIFDDCVAPIVDALFHGYNGTVLAYGQTGSGKTYTMGTNYNGDDHSGGVIPKVIETIFSRVEASEDSTEYLIRVSFIEIFKEEVFDLLDPSPPAFSRGDVPSQAKPSGPARVPIQIRETINGEITLAGVTEAEVRTKEEMATNLLRGSVARATGSTNMNSQSSRSHAIFTIALEQKKIGSCPGKSIHNDDGDDILIAKLHLVDLAGSERAKRTGADGMRFREGIHINKGLLALGNVISALGDEKRRKEGGHVPYRDSKLTRLLQDSLGGNSKTVMIACVSPADTNAEETLNTLKYANRARNIQNKAIINRDPVAAQMQKMRGQIEELQTELLLFRGDSGASVEELQILKHKISLLEASNKELQRELQDRKIECEHLTQRALDAQIEKDKLLMKIESARNGKSWDEIDSDSHQEFDLLKSYVTKIQELEGELLRVQNRYILKETKHCKIINHSVVEDEVLHSELSLGSDGKDDDVEDEAEVEVKELEHSSLQQQLDRELKELDQKLEQKEAEMKRFATTDTSVLKQHFTKKIHELEQEKRNFQKEIEELKNKLANISSNTDESAQKLKEDYLHRMNTLETQVVQLKKKQEAQAQLQRQKEKSDEAAKRLHDEIHRIKTQKVQLQQKIKQESEQFRLWKASREKEVLQLKKEGRRNEYEMHKLVALNQRQKMVLQRKTEEAAMASKRLKELLDTRKASSRDLSGAGNATATIQALMQAVEHELEVASRVHEVRSEYERQMKERAKMAKELAQLKEEALSLKQMNLSGSPHTMSPGARSSRQFALENMLSTSSSAIVSMASHLSEAEERERAFTGRGRWNQVRSLVEAKNVMNYLFNLASTSRCQLWDKEVICREKDMEIRELKEKVVHLVKQVEMQKNALTRQENLHKLSAKKHAKDHLVDSGTSALNYGKGNMYQLRQTGFRSSMAFSNAGNSIQILEDMDISNSDDGEDQDPDDDSEWEASRPQKAKRRNSKTDKNLTILKQPSLSSENESVTEEFTGEEIVPENQKGMCCTCTKSSSCKTMKCECRAKGGVCDKMCGCVPSKCSNREPNAHDDEREISQNLASQGALLLQSALSEKPIEPNGENEHVRKALSDIGNTLVKSKALNPSQRKKWKKSTFQLVPAGTTPQPETTESERKPVVPATEIDMHLQLPRAMRATAMNTNPLKERNSEHQNEVAVNKEERTTTPTPTSPREYGIRGEKENGGV